MNVSFLGILDPNTNAYLKPEQLHEQFKQVGASNKERVITYCGAAIAATSDAFVLTLLGVDNVAVYDDSMTEWSTDPSLPLVTGRGKDYHFLSIDL